MGTMLVISLEQIRPRRRRLLVLGAILIALGLFAVIYLPAATVVSVLALGWLMIVGATIEGISAFHTRGLVAVLLNVFGATLGILAGLIIVSHPLSGALILTFLLAIYFLVTGLFRIIAAIYLKYRSSGWAVFDGVVTLVLGLLIWLEWPTTAMWFLGLALGIILMLRGWAIVIFALAVHALPQRGQRLENANHV